MDYKCKITLTNGENVVIEEENIECVLKDDILYFTLKNYVIVNLY